MPVDLSVKKFPDDVSEQLCAQARRHHRSLQGELLSILKEAAGPTSPLTIINVLEHGRRIGLRTADESVQMIREDRDGL